MSRAVFHLVVLTLLGSAYAARKQIVKESSGDELQPTLPPPPKEERFEIKRLPIEFLVDSQAVPLRDGNSNWFCVKIRLLPEDGGDKFSVLAKRLGESTKSKYRVSLKSEDENLDTANMDGSATFLADIEPAPSAQQTPYRSVRSKHFIEKEHAEEDAICRRQGGVYANYAELQQYVHERLTKNMGDGAPPVRNEDDKDVLEKHIEKWNRRWARPGRAGGNSNGCATFKECSGYHVSYVKIPDAVQAHVEERLENNWDTFYETYGAGIAGTTGAHFVAGNRGYRRPDWGGDMMKLLWPEEGTKLKAYEDALARVVRTRADVIQKLGENADIDFQHRLWRYGPDFSVRGGLWHRDTCPFGIGGGVPKGSWQLTSVYVLYASNLDLSQSGTRLKDRFGKTHEMPCAVGTTNIMRSGENDPVSPWHSGPVLQKVNASLPGYRVMMQTKMVLSKAALDKPAGAEMWGPLGIKELPVVSAEAEKGVLQEWFYNMSQAIAWGASESNAVGSEAYPINAQRAWSRTEELAHYFGFQGGFLPTFAVPPVDVEDANQEPHEDGDSDWTEEFPADVA